MQSGENDPFILKNFFILDPLHEIYSRKREDTDFFNAYVDYLQYLKYLGIIWKRIKSENIEIGLLHAEAMKLLDTQEQIPEKWKSLEHNKQEMLTVLQLDFESLVIFCRLLLDKVANLIEHLIELPKGIKPGSGFTEHKKAFTKDSSIHPLYSDFLKKRTYWYEQELQLLRNKIIIHSGTLTSGASVSMHKGVAFRKTYGISPLKGKDKEYFLRIKRKYEDIYPNFRVLENDYEMTDYFLAGIRKYKIKLDDDDRITIAIASRA